MAPAPKAIVKPTVLKWLRTASGLTIEETASKLQTQPDNLIAWEAGQKNPSMPQLRNLAKAFKRPISYFYLPKPMDEPSIPHDFRRLPKSDDDRHYSPALRHEIRTAYDRRSIALDLAKETGCKIPTFDIIGTQTINDDPEQVGQQLRKIVGMTYCKQLTWRKSRNAYNGWRNHIEALGVLVFQITTVELSQMLGFSLPYRELPVIGINQKNKLNGRTFSMLHEFVHLLLDESGLCDIDDTLPRKSQEQRVEIFCNHAAGVAMVPRNELLTHPIVTANGTQAHDWDNADIATLSRDFGASEEVIVRRLLINQLTTQDFYTLKRAEFTARNESQEKKKHKQSGKFFRNMAQETASNLSSFARIVLDSYHSDIINLSEASEHLGVRAEIVADVDNLIRR